MTRSMSLPLSRPCCPPRRQMNVFELSRLHVRVAVAAALFSALACILAWHLIWNWTPSLPLGLYWLSRGAPPARGELVAFPVPSNVEDLVRDRKYLPPGAMLVKTVVAGAGDRVCTEDGTFTVNGHALAGGGRIAATDTAGRPLPHYEGCGPVPEGWVYVASHYARSFDSRTFGPVRASDIRGTVMPLWTY
jgi:conjugative transfer signal peptidase TraF